MNKVLLCIFLMFVSAQVKSDAFTNFVSDIGFDQKLNDSLPLQLEFRDESGKSVFLKDYFGQKPAVLALVYYECPMLCNEVMNGIGRALKAVSLDPGKDFQLITISIDPNDTPQLAAKKRWAYSKEYFQDAHDNNFHCLTGEEGSIKALADSLGFKFRYDPASKQFAHAAGIVVLTPKGKISRYFFGIDYSPKELQRSLADAAQENTSSPVRQLLLLCYDYDPMTGKYGFAIMKTLRLAGLATVCGFGGSILWMLRRERRGRR